MKIQGIYLNQKSLRILKCVFRLGIIRGASLKKEAKIFGYTAFRNALKPLLKEKLIHIEGSLDDAGEIAISYFSFKPSSYGRVRSVLLKYGVL